MFRKKWPNFFLMNVFFALKGSKFFYNYFLTFEDCLKMGGGGQTWDVYQRDILKHFRSAPIYIHCYIHMAEFQCFFNHILCCHSMDYYLT